MAPGRRAFVIMPFGTKRYPSQTAKDGYDVDCDAIYKEFLEPAIAATGLKPHRADLELRAGSIHLDMFQDLLLSEFVVADLTFDNPNIWYEIGVRHALRAGGSVMTYAARDKLPFDVAPERMLRYTLKDGKLDPDKLEKEKTGLSSMITATLEAWRGHKVSPIYQLLPYLQEPDWKTLKVGAIQEFWKGLDAWQQRVEIAGKKQRPGDILVLADETPNSVLEFEALCTAAEALMKLNRPRYALNIIEQARKIDPDNRHLRQLEGRALGRAERYADASAKLGELAKQFKDGETLGLFARTLKDEWTNSWKDDPQYAVDPLAAARNTASALKRATEAYIAAFRINPADHYPGINALTLGRLWEHITGRNGKFPLDLIAQGVAWCVDTAIETEANYWALATRAELSLLGNSKQEAIDDYADAAELAITKGDRHALDSTSQQLDFLGALNFNPEIVQAAADVINAAEQRLNAKIGIRKAGPAEPQHVVVFSGHMIDNPKVRGPGKEKPARFPAEKADAAAVAIAAALDRVGAGAGDLGLCGGASGGDLLFAEACLARKMRVELRLARDEAAFLEESVTFADPGHRWENSFMKVKAHPDCKTLIMPDELGPAPDGVSVHDRCNRWILYTALSQGLTRLSSVVLWNGEPGDGPGGTQHMVELVRKLTGRQPEIIDPAKL